MQNTLLKPIKIMNAITKNKIENNLASYLNQSLRMDLLPIKERLELEEQSRIISLNKKAVLFTETETPKGLYILLKGKIKISQLNADGSEQILFILTDGELFGYRNILNNQKHVVTATCLEPCDVMLVERDHFLRILKSSPNFSYILLENVGHEFTALVNRINIFAQKNIKERLALFLLLLNQVYRTPHQIEDASEIKVNRSDLASFTGTSIENLVRTIKIFKEKNYVHTMGKSIFIVDFDALYELAGI
jgi:CRP-like cAMP-binding protein